MTDEHVIEITGADVKTWLQGQLTNDIALCSEQEWQGHCICSAKGQIEDIVSVRESENGYLILSSKPHVILGRVKDFVIMEDVTANWTSLKVYAVQGAGTGGGFNLCPSGGRIELSESTAIANIQQATDDEISLASLISGIPIQGVDTTDKTLPPELGSHFLGQHVSHNKGCYVGQEVLQRIHSRGHTNREWVLLQCESAVQAGNRVSTEENEVAGVITRCELSQEFGWVAGAMMRGDSETATISTLEGPVNSKRVPFAPSNEA